jgi:outer membrane protein assembly factor BamB
MFFQGGQVLTQRSRIISAAAALLLLGVLLSACGSTPVAQTWPGLTLDGNTLYAISGSPQKVYMVDAETGTQKQTFPQNWLDLIGAQQPRGVVYWSPVAVGGDAAFVGFADATAKLAGLYAFDPSTGQKLWQVAVESYIQDPPTYADGVVYVGDTAGNVYAVDTEAKAIKPGWPFKAGSAIWASPLAAEGRVYVASMDHSVYCLDAASGQLVWKAELGGAMAGQPLLEDGILYVGAFDGKEYALRADTGEPVPEFAFKAGNWIWSKALMTGGQLYVTALDGKLYALDPSTGKATWFYDSSTASGGKDVIRADPVQAGGFIVVGTESGRVIAVDNGQQRWSWPSGVPVSAVYTTPVVSGDRIYVLLMNGQVQTLDAANGNPGWAFSPPQAQ